MLAKVFVCDFDCNSSGAVREVGGLVVRKKGALPELADFFASLPAWLRCPVRCELEPGEPMIVTCTKTVTVCTEPGPNVPRTVNWLGPAETVESTCTGKEPGSPTVTLPGVAWKPNGKFGKSMNTVPAKPVLGTTCTVRGSVMLCVTGAGALLVVAGFRLSEKSGCKTRAALTVAVMLPELSWPVMTSVKGCAPLKTVGAVVGANTVKLIVPVGPEGFGVNWTSMDWLPILPWPVNVIDPLNPPMGTTANVPLTEPPKRRSVLNS